MLLSPARILLITLLLSASAAADTAPAKVSIRIAAAAPVRVMEGGIGASWHAIETPMRGDRPTGGALGGSAWGANPPAEDETAWRALHRHANWLGLDWSRVEVEQRMYEPERKRYDWDNPEMRILYRILDWAETSGADVFLQQMWGNVEWNAYPELRKSPAHIAISAPYSMEDFAESLAELAEHLIRRKGYRSIKWLCINNEPGHDWSWWQGPDGKPLPITPGLRAVREALDRRGLALPLAGPDWTDMPEFNAAKLDFDLFLGAYDIHSYNSVFDGMSGSYDLTTAKQRLSEWAHWAHARSKPLFLSEAGTMAYGWGGTDPGPSSYDSGLKNASLTVRAINHGADAVNRWSFTNRGDLDGQWQLVDTWDVEGGRLLESFRPHPNSYYQWGILSRFTAKNSGVLATTVQGDLPERNRTLVAAALRSPAGDTTVIVVNEMASDAEAEISLEGLTKQMTLHRYAVTPSDRDRSDVLLLAESRAAVDPAGNSFAARIPALSIVVYSTYKLSMAEPGVTTVRCSP